MAIVRITINDDGEHWHKRIWLRLRRRRPCPRPRLQVRKIKQKEKPHNNEIPMKPILSSSRRPDIKFYSSGRIDICARVSKALALSPGDAIDILAQDGEYYLYVIARARDSLGRHHAICQPSKIGSHHFRSWSAPLARAILSATHANGSVSLPAGKPLLLGSHIAIPIITLNIL